MSFVLPLYYCFGVFHDGVYLAMLALIPPIHFAIHNNLITSNVWLQMFLVHGMLVHSATTLRQAAERSLKQGLIGNYCTP